MRSAGGTKSGPALLRDARNEIEDRLFRSRRRSTRQRVGLRLRLRQRREAQAEQDRKCRQPLLSTTRRLIPKERVSVS